MVGLDEAFAFEGTSKTAKQMVAVLNARQERGAGVELLSQPLFLVSMNQTLPVTAALDIIVC